MRFMALTRAANQPGPDGKLGTADDVQDAKNTDTPFVDKSQTYTSHAAHQVFLREYANDASGRPVATGNLLGRRRRRPAHLGGHQAAGPRAARPRSSPTPTCWTCRQILTDAYGKFVPGPARGLPQYVTATGLVEGDTAQPGRGAGQRAALRHAVPHRHRAQRRPDPGRHRPQPGHPAGRAPAPTTTPRPAPTSPRSRPARTTTRCSTPTTSPVTAG